MLGQDRAVQGHRIMAKHDSPSISLSDFGLVVRDGLSAVARQPARNVCHGLLNVRYRYWGAIIHHLICKLGTLQARMAKWLNGIAMVAPRWNPTEPIVADSDGPRLFVEMKAVSVSNF